MNTETLKCNKCGAKELPKTEKLSNGAIKASCSACGAYIKFLPHGGAVKLWDFDEKENVFVSQVPKHMLEWHAKKNKNVADRVKAQVELAARKRRRTDDYEATLVNSDRLQEQRRRNGGLTDEEKGEAAKIASDKRRAAAHAERMLKIARELESMPLPDEYKGGNEDGERLPWE